MALVYLYPNGAKAPTQAQMGKRGAAMHCTVAFADEETPPSIAVDIVHNYQFDLEKPPEDLQLPLLAIVPMAGGPDASAYAVTVKDGNTVTVTKLKNGAGTSITLDIWIFRHASSSFPFFG